MTKQDLTTASDSYWNICMDPVLFSRICIGALALSVCLALALCIRPHWEWRWGCVGVGGWLWDGVVCVGGGAWQLLLSPSQLLLCLQECVCCFPGSSVLSPALLIYEPLIRPLRLPALFRHCAVTCILLRLLPPPLLLLPPPSTSPCQWPCGWLHPYLWIMTGRQCLLSLWRSAFKSPGWAKVFAWAGMDVFVCHVWVAESRQPTTLGLPLVFWFLLRRNTDVRR